MALRVVKVDEYQFLTCVKHAVWGSKKARFSKWAVGDLLIFLVEKHLAAMAEVSGKTYISNSVVWDNGAFPHRLPLRFITIIAPPNRPPILGAVRDALVRAWGDHYGLGIVNQHPMEGEEAAILASTLRGARNNLTDYLANIEEYLLQAKALTGATAKRNYPRRSELEPRPVVAEPASLPLVPETVDVPVEVETKAHTKAQAELVALGKVTGCSVWVAANDKNRTHNGQPISVDCLQRLPGMGLNPEVTKRISLIDVIWVRQNAPVCAFEIETSTSIYSGLLRMSDLLALIPAINIKIYIVAPEERRDKVMAELSRPTFRKIGLNDYCKYISTTELSRLLEKVKDLSGHVEPGVVDKIAYELEEEEEFDF